MNARTTTVLAAAAVVATIAAGCGGGGDSASTGESAAFGRRASETCKKAREGAFEQIAAYEKKYSAEGLPAAVSGEKAIRTVLLVTIEAEIAGIREAGAAAGYEQQIEALVSELQATFDGAKANTKLSPTQIEDAFRGTDKKLRAYKLTACSKSG